MDKPLISVIIPTRDSAETITEAIRSIQGQTYANLEIMIVDDNSFDSTVEIANKIATTDQRVKVYSLPYDDTHRFDKNGKNVNAGYMARNYGFHKVHGQWITFQDADDASLANRIEVQYDLARRFDATHVCVDWQKFNPEYLDKKFDMEKMSHDHGDVRGISVSPGKISTLARKTKGIMFSVLGPFNKYIPFVFKHAPIVNKLFFGSLAPYPGTGNSPLFKREVIDKVTFRPLPERVWPSFTGRGADRDFNFQVAETFGNSYVFFIPLYMWRKNTQNERYADYGQYIIK